MAFIIAWMNDAEFESVQKEVRQRLKKPTSHQRFAEDIDMRRDQFRPPKGAFTRSVPVRFSHCDPAGIVYFPHYFDMFNGLIEDWYGEELGYDYAGLITDSQYAFPFVHIECDFKIPSRMGDVIQLTLLVDRIGRSSLGIAIVCHRDGLERLRARMVTAMMSLETGQPVPLPQLLRDKIESYRKRISDGIAS